MPFQIVRNDITKMHVDAIVNAANSSLKMGGGVCGAIFAAAGAKQLQQECDSIGSCATGEAVMTKGYDLPSPYIIHTVGPIWRGGNDDEASLLSRCYVNSLKLAVKHSLRSVAFPLISTGIFGYPKDEALQIALSEISKFIMENEIMVYLVVYDHHAFSISEKLFKSIETFIDDHYTDTHSFYENQRTVYENLSAPDKLFESSYADSSPSVPSLKKQKKRDLKDILSQLEESFSENLLRLIDEKGKTDVEIYKKANIDRKLFSKIRNNKHYNPSKVTAIAFAIALELSLDETKDLLSKAGYSLSRSSKFDVIIEYFIEENIYDVFKINEALFAFEQVLLGE